MCVQSVVEALDGKRGHYPKPLGNALSQPMAIIRGIKRIEDNIKSVMLCELNSEL